MKYEYWLATMPHVSSADKIFLNNIFGNAKELYNSQEELISQLQMLSSDTKEAILLHKKEWDLQKEYEKLLKQDIWFTTYMQMDYPVKLKEIYQPPYVLFVKGSLPQESLNLAIVGARKCTNYGMSATKSISGALAHAGVGVISGMALGIDTAAHVAALENGGKTYAVLGCGVDVCYPAQNRMLYEKIAANGGIISEYPPGAVPDKFHFPMRNRIISGLSDGVIVVEAKKKSGSLITADRALEQGKSVYAVPGRIQDTLSYGSNWLISQGATPVFDTEVLIKELGLKSDNVNIQKNFTKNRLEKKQELVYSVVDLTEKHLDTIVEETGLTFLEVVKILFELTQMGLVEEIYKNYYCKIVG